MKGAEDALGRLEGVEAVTVDLQRGLAKVTPAAGARIEPRAIFDAVRHATFTPEAVTYDVQGEVRRAGGKARIFVAGDPEPYLDLPEPAPPDGPARVQVRFTADGRASIR